MTIHSNASRRGLAALAIIAAFAASNVAAQAYPARPIRVIVPFAPGTGLDQTVRLMGEKFQQATGQPLVVDNKGGAGGNIGTDAVAKAAPDGYTIGLIAINMLVINPHLYKDLP
jgi:tripartite-type tricarboxylate transporter receptor subunit TctC